jgi:hypothetical protein
MHTVTPFAAGPIGDSHQVIEVNDDQAVLPQYGPEWVRHALLGSTIDHGNVVTVGRLTVPPPPKKGR